MKLNKNMMILLALLSVSFIDAKHTSTNKGEAVCQCYCSYLCGPRDADQPDDAPFIDPATGICFCQERDRKVYFKHGCDKYNNAKNFKSCCESQE